MNHLDLTSRIRLRNVVLATDFSDSSKAAVGYAATVARHYHGSVYAVHVIPPYTYNFIKPAMVVSIEEDVRCSVEKQMHALLDSEQLRGIPTKGIIEHGEIWEALEQLAIQHHADLIVTGTRGRRGLKKLVMGSVAEEILQLSAVPVLTVRPDVRQSGAGGLRTILYPTDFSADSMRAMAYALSLAQEFQGCIILLHVAPGTHSDPEVRNRLQVFFIDQLRQLVPPETRSWCRQEFVIEFGEPTAAILKCAESYNADLVVMGVRGAGAIAKASAHFGSTAYRIISEARAPVLSVRRLYQDIIR